MAKDWKAVAQAKLRGMGKEKTAPWTLNLVGFRDTEKVNAFNDSLVYWYYDEKGIVIEQVDKFTTDPGLTTLKSPENVKGCAILCSGFYEKMWTIGYHKGQYKALVQASPCKVYRDNNKDEKIDFMSKTLESGVFGINLHRATSNGESTIVNAWSAGCQVVANTLQFNKLMTIASNCNVKSGQKWFDYLLLNIKTDL
jgi:hypothetical protein